MTKEEALHILDLMYDVADELHENTDGDEWYWKQMQALTMAMKSLKGEPMRNDYITRLVQICLDIANIADERGEADEPYFKELGLGYRALSGILRRGCKEIIDLQNDYHGEIEAKNLAKIGEQEAHDILEEMFGDREVYTINDKDKERIKVFVRSIQDEWERRTDE